jgi:hypothetical protein
LLRLHADETVDELTVFKEEHGGYARDLKARCDLRVLVNVQLRDAILPLRLGRKLIHHRTDDAARSTPRRPTINQHRLSSRRQHLAFESLISDYLRL